MNIESMSVVPHAPNQIAALRHDIRGFLALAQQWNFDALESSANSLPCASANALVASHLQAIEDLVNAHLVNSCSLEKQYDTVLNSIKRTIKLYQPIAEAKGISIAITASERSRPTKINYAEILSLFGNVVLNAIQNAKSSVVIDINDAKTSWIVTVRNDGAVMPHKYIKYLMGGPLPKNYEGLGLQIIRSVTHGNKMGLDVKGTKQGTTVKIYSSLLAAVI